MMMMMMMAAAGFARRIVQVQIRLRQVVHDVCGLCGGEQGDCRAVAEEAQVAEVGHD